MPITSSSETFASFFNDWLRRHRQFVQQLAHLPDETTTVTPIEEESLVSNFISHCLQYYDEKSVAMSVAGDDVYVFFSPPWLSSYEKLILWIGGFKPGMVFKLITTSVNDLTSHQIDQLENIRSETKRRERDLMQKFALLQQSVGDPLLMFPFRRIGVLSLGEGEQSQMEEAMDVLKAEMITAMKNADQLRCVTVGKVVEGFLIRYVFQVVVYSIWRERNGRRHGEDPQPADSIIRWIDKQIRNQISAIRQHGDRRYETAYQLWLQARD